MSSGFDADYRRGLEEGEPFWLRLKPIKSMTGDEIVAELKLVFEADRPYLELY